MSVKSVSVSYEVEHLNKICNTYLTGRSLVQPIRLILGIQTVVSELMLRSSINAESHLPVVLKTIMIFKKCIFQPHCNFCSVVGFLIRT